MLKRLFLLAITCLSTLSCHGNQYTYIDLGTLSFTDSFPQSINERGDVLGFAWNGDKRYPFVWTIESGLKILDQIPGTPYVTNINNKGQVAGHTLIREKGWFRGSWKQHAFIWSAENGFIDLGTIGGNDTYVRLIDNKGDLLLVQDEHAYLWQNGQVTKIESASNAIYDPNLDIFNLVMNSKKQIAVIKRVGNTIVDLLINVESKAEKSFLHSYEGTPYVTAINCHGDLAGFTTFNNKPVGFIVKANGCTTHIPDFEIYGLNDRGVAVGRIIKDGKPTGGIFIDNTLQNINDLIADPHFHTFPWNEILCVEKINNHGGLIAVASFYDQTHAIKLIPLCLKEEK